MEHAVWQTEGGLDFSLFLTLSWMPFHSLRSSILAGFPGSVLLGLRFHYTSVGMANAAGVQPYPFSHLQLQYSALCVNKDFLTQAPDSVCLRAFSSSGSMLDETGINAQQQSSVTEQWNGVGRYTSQPLHPEEGQSKGHFLHVAWSPPQDQGPQLPRVAICLLTLPLLTSFPSLFHFLTPSLHVPWDYF